MLNSICHECSLCHCLKMTVRVKWQNSDTIMFLRDQVSRLKHAWLRLIHGFQPSLSSNSSRVGGETLEHSRLPLHDSFLILLGPDCITTHPRSYVEDDISRRLMLSFASFVGRWGWGDLRLLLFWSLWLTTNWRSVPCTTSMTECDLGLFQRVSPGVGG